MLKIEAVTICSKYSDFLAESAKYNRGLFDNWVIVTTPDDVGTQEICRKLNLKCLLTTDGVRQKGAFAKGKMVERGLQQLSNEGWRVHIDADVVLPHDFRLRLEMAAIQNDTIYGVDRLMVPTWEKWVELQRTGFLNGGSYDYHCRVNLNHLSLPVGTRWAHPEQGWVPIGFFQMWHSSEEFYRGIRRRPYPGDHNDAARTDVQFGLKWDRHKRAMLSEVVAVHLESGPSKHGANWNGRTTPPFGPNGASILAASSAPNRVGSS